MSYAPQRLNVLCVGPWKSDEAVGDEAELVAELEAVLGLLGGVRRVEGLDPVEADVAHQALDQVAHLLGVLDVPVGVGDDGDARRRRG